MKLLIAGDFYVSDGYKDKELIDRSVVDLFANADYRMLNLEFPVTDNIIKNLKTGPYLKASGNTVLPLLKKLKIDGVTLANNHILDYGSEGLFDTIKFLDGNNIKHVGAGANRDEASKPLYIDNDGQMIAVLNFAEKEWSISGDELPGANSLDIIDNINQLKKAKEQAKYVIVIIHGGHEYCNYPSPRMVKQYRHYAENGASVIVGHHTHCIGGYEVHNKVPIFYSLGNYLFTKKSVHPDWYTGLVLEINFDKSAINWHLHPVKQSNDFKLSLIEGNQRALVMNDIKKYSNIISDETLLKENWLSFIFSLEQQYLNAFNPFNFIKNRKIRVFLIKLGLTRVFMNKNHYAIMLNHMRCEAHSDASQLIIDKFLHKKGQNNN